VLWIVAFLMPVNVIDGNLIGRHVLASTELRDVWRGIRPLSISLHAKADPMLFSKNVAIPQIPIEERTDRPIVGHRHWDIGGEMSPDGRSGGQRGSINLFCVPRKHILLPSGLFIGVGEAWQCIDRESRKFGNSLCGLECYLSLEMQRWCFSSACDNNIYLPMGAVGRVSEARKIKIFGQHGNPSALVQHHLRLRLAQSLLGLPDFGNWLWPMCGS
jgi:hypothetical protein